MALSPKGELSGLLDLYSTPSPAMIVYGCLYQWSVVAWIDVCMVGITRPTGDKHCHQQPRQKYCRIKQIFSHLWLEMSLNAHNFQGPVTISLYFVVKITQNMGCILIWKFWKNLKTLTNWTIIGPFHNNSCKAKLLLPALIPALIIRCNYYRLPEKAGRLCFCPRLSVCVSVCLCVRAALISDIWHMFIIARLSGGG